jgi:hypothetical protein
LLRVDHREQTPGTHPADIGVLNRYDRPQPSLEAYEQLRPNWMATEVIQ